MTATKTESTAKKNSPIRKTQIATSKQNSPPSDQTPLAGKKAIIEECSSLKKSVHVNRNQDNINQKSDLAENTLAPPINLGIPHKAVSRRFQPKDKPSGRTSVKCNNEPMTNSIETSGVNYLEKIETSESETLSPKRVSYRAEKVKSIISYNHSRDLPFDRSIDAYSGCEQGCIYHFNSPTQNLLNLSTNIKNDTNISFKESAAILLEREMAQPGYECAPIALGASSDPYQPIEKEQGLTRELLKMMLKYRHPVSIMTKNPLILRDIDILQELAKQNLVSVTMSITTTDDELKPILEPLTATSVERANTISELHKHNIPVGVLISPIIPKINEQEIEEILTLAREAGASSAGYTIMRLPSDSPEALPKWLDQHLPGQTQAVVDLVRSIHNDNSEQTGFGTKAKGAGPFAKLLNQKFHVAARKLGFTDHSQARNFALDCALFTKPANVKKPKKRSGLGYKLGVRKRRSSVSSAQMSLF